MDAIKDFLSALPPEIAVIVAGSLPVLELRGAIPFGVFYFGMPAWKAMVLALIGNLIPIPFLLVILSPLRALSRRVELIRKFLQWLERRAREKGASVEKWELLGLYLFVAIPFPGTGAWMGSVVAQVFDISFSKALITIVLGVITAGFVVAFASHIGWWAVVILFGGLFLLGIYFSRT